MNTAAELKNIKAGDILLYFYKERYEPVRRLSAYLVVNQVRTLIRTRLLHKYEDNEINNSYEQIYFSHQPVRIGDYDTFNSSRDYPYLKLVSGSEAQQMKAEFLLDQL